MSKTEDIQKEIEELKKKLSELTQIKMYYVGKCSPLGTVGEKTDIKDMNDEELYTGDVIRLWGFQGEDNGTKSVVKVDGKYFIPGIKDGPLEVREKLFRIEKVKSYKDIKEGYRTQGVIYATSKESAKEMINKEMKIIEEAFKESMKTDEFKDFLKAVLGD